MLKNSQERYGIITKVLHWLVALLMIGVFILGWYMVDLTYFDPWYNRSLSLHKSLGILVLELGFIKILWSLHSRLPKLGDTIKPWEKAAAKATHGVLLAMLILLPVSGYAISTSDGSGISFFGLFEIPALLPSSQELGKIASEIHYYLAYGTGFLVGLHALAAFKHHFINQDDTLKRML